MSELKIVLAARFAGAYSIGACITGRINDIRSIDREERSGKKEEEEEEVDELIRCKLQVVAAHNLRAVKCECHRKTLFVLFSIQLIDFSPKHQRFRYCH